MLVVMVDDRFVGDAEDAVVRGAARVEVTAVGPDDSDANHGVVNTGAAGCWRTGPVGMGCKSISAMEIGATWGRGHSLRMWPLTQHSYKGVVLRLEFFADCKGGQA